MAAKKKARRTTHRTSTGTKLYAKRDAGGRITDIQTYKRAHGADLRRKSTKTDAVKKKKKTVAKALVKARPVRTKVKVVAKRRVAGARKSVKTAQSAGAKRVAAVRASVRKAPVRRRAAVKQVVRKLPPKARKKAQKTAKQATTVVASMQASVEKSANSMVDQARDIAAKVSDSVQSAVATLTGDTK